MLILILNAGSSSYKLALYLIDSTPSPIAPDPLWQGAYEWGEVPGKGQMRAWWGSKILIDRIVKEHGDLENTIKDLLDTIFTSHNSFFSSFSAIAAVGHRIVHGGDRFQQPVLINNKVKTEIKKLFPLAPLHNPANLKGIEIVELLLPLTPQVAVFDTVFHSTIPEESSLYPGPFKWKRLGIKRYGFHGISHEYCMLRCAQLLETKANHLKIITCHLGNGSSLAAIRHGKSIDTTMGFTPIEGLMMGTRSGSIDPGILLFLLDTKKMTETDLFQVLNYESGLKGISGKSSDMREILAASSQGNKRAKLALKMYLHSLKKNMGSMIANLEGVDAIVFAGGIGENSSKIRKEACRSFSYLGVKIDDRKNRHTSAKDAIISSVESTTDVLVIHTKEVWFIACACWQILQKRVEGKKQE